MTKQLRLTQGFVALIDDNIYEQLMQLGYKRHVHFTNSGPVASMNPGGSGRVYLHRMIVGARSGEQVDHINGDTLDNRAANLRKATGSQNCANTGKKSRRGGTSSKYKGVSYWKGNEKWKAKITKDYKDFHLGYFDKEEDAARAYDEAAKRLFGEFALLNFPEGS